MPVLIFPVISSVTSIQEALFPTKPMNFAVDGKLSQIHILKLVFVGISIAVIRAMTKSSLKERVILPYNSTEVYIIDGSQGKNSWKNLGTGVEAETMEKCYLFLGLVLTTFFIHPSTTCAREVPIMDWASIHQILI